MLLKVDFRVINHRIPVVFDSFQSVTTAIESEPYTGAYEITPTEEDQSLDTTGKLMNRNVLVKAIPQEYGRVTYDNRKVITIT